MLKILAQIVCSLLIFVTSSVAKDVPLVKNIDIYIPYKEFSVIEFPFEVKGYDFTPFVYTKSIGIKKDKSIDPTSYKAPSLQPSVKSLSNRKKVTKLVKQRLAMKKAKNSSPINVAKGKNLFRLYPKKVGKTELLVWGYKKFPIMINLIITKDVTKANKLISFIDLSQDLKKAEDFESTYHDRVIVKITKALYANSLPRGYKEEITKKEFFSNTLHVVLIKRYLGRRYMGEEYIVINKNDKTISLDSKMFEGNGIYGITFINNILSPGSSTRVFVVRERSHV